MWPSIRDAIVLFFTDKAYFASKWDRWVAKVRGLLMTGGLAATIYSDQLSAAIGRPEWNKRIQVASILLAGMSLMLRAGDKTPAEVKALAASMRKDA